MNNPANKSDPWLAAWQKAASGLLFALILLSFNQTCFGGGWYVGNTAPGEWIQYTNVWLANGHYRFTARAGATTNGAALHLEIDGAAVVSGAPVPNTARPDAFVYVPLGSTQVSQGYHNLRVVFETGGVSLDWFMLCNNIDTTNGLKNSDITMIRPPTDGLLIAPIVGYEHHEDTSFPADSPVQLGLPDLTDINGHPFTTYQLTNWYGVPMYRDFDRRSDRYWDILVDQLLASRAQVPFIHCRETADFTNALQDRAYTPGGGWYEGRWLQKFSEAVARNPQAVSSLKIGMFWESGGIATGFQNHFGFLPGWGTPGFVDYVMQCWVQPWFDNIPAELLYQPVPNRPVISFFASTPDSIVQDGQMGAFMAEFRSRMMAKYGMDPLIIMPVGGGVDAPTLSQAWGQAPWVTWDGPLFTSNYFAGTYWGTASSGSRRRIDTVWLNDWNPITNTGSPNTNDADGHDSHQPRLDANGNSMMWNALNQAKTLGTRFVQEEGFYNISEGNSIFRSFHPEWKYPNQHMNAMREFADPATMTLMFEAEGCDSYYKTTTNDNTGGTYRKEWYRPTTLDVYRPLHNAQGWVQMNPGGSTLVQMDAGFFDVWALDNSGHVWAQAITGDANTWHQVSLPQAFTCVSIGKLYAWGIAGTTVYSTSLPYPGNAWGINGWNQRSGSMTQLNVGATEVWAVNASGQVFRRPVDGTGDWTQVNGTMDKIAVGSAFVWGISGGHIYYSLTSLANPSWTECPNPYHIVQLNVGSDEVWGVDATGNVYRMSASGVGSWDLMDGNLKSVCVGDGYVWGLSNSVPCYRRLEGFSQPGVALTPFSPKATPTNGQVLLAWTFSSGAATYNVKRGTTSGGPYATIANTNVAGFTDNNVANGTTYYYVVSAANASGESANSGEARAMPQAIPASPSNLSATAVSATQVNLAWTNNSANIYGVKIERKTGAGGTYVEIQRAAGTNVTSFSDVTVVFNTQYYYRIRAYGAGGDSAYGAEVNVTTPASQGGTGSGTIVREVWTNIPGTAVTAIPTNTLPNFTYVLTSLEGPTNWGDNYGARMRGYITAPSSGYYTFWIASDDNSALYLSTDTQASNKVLIAQVTGWTGIHAWNSFSSQRSPAIFLNGGLSYYVEVLHKEGGGNDSVAVGWATPGQDTSAPSQVIPGLQLSPYSAPTGVAPAAPSGLIATVISGVQINLTWADNSGNEQRFKIERKTGADGAYSQVGEVGAGVTNFYDANLLPTTGYYYYRVRAGNSAGDSAYSAEVAASPLPGVPVGPNDLVATAVSSSQVNLNWMDNANNETGYAVERKLGVGGTYSQIDMVAAGAISFSDTGLTPSTISYYYRVRATNAVGNSIYSNEAQAATVPSTPAPPPPGALAAIAGNSQVSLVWSAYSGADTYNVKRSTTSGNSYTIIQSNITATSFADLAVTNGTRYYYVVSGVSANNEGANSMEVSAVPSVPPFYTNTIAGNWNTVTWQPNPPGKPAAGIQTTVVFANNSPINSTNDMGAFTLNQLFFASQTVNLAGGQLVFDGATPLFTNVQNNAFTIANALTLNQPIVFGINSNNTTLSGGVGGIGSLSKVGAGTLILSGTNTYAGGTTINNGILQLGDGVNNGVIAGSIINNSPVTGGLTINNGTAQTSTTAISSLGSVVKTGSGTLTWGLQCGYTGATVINGGTIINAGGVNGLGASWSSVNINSNATWAFNGISASVGTLTLTNGNCGISRNGNLNFSNVVSSGISSLGVSEMKMGPDQANGKYAALFNVIDGTLTLNINKLYDFTANATGSVTKAGSGTLLIANLGTSYKGSTTISNGVLQVSVLANGGTDSHIGQSSSAATNLILNGGTLKYAGALVACDRLFSLGANGGTLDASGSGALTFANPGAVGFMDAGTHALTLTGSSVAANTFAAVLGDNGGPTALIKTGTGLWFLTGASTFSGGTTVSNGTLAVSATAMLGSGNVTINSGATCIIQNSGALAGGAYVYVNGVMNFGSGVTNTVQRLYIGGNLQPAGLWNAARDAVHFAGLGGLMVTTGSAPGPVALNAAVLSGSQIQVSWTTNDGGAFRMYATPDLTPPVNWTLVTNLPVIIGGQWTLTLPANTNNHAYYRLQQQ